MEDQLDNTTLDNAISQNETLASVIDKEQSFIPVEEMFDTPEYDEYIDMADVSEIQQLQASAPLANKYGISALANMGAPRPSVATNTYDPLSQQAPPTINGIGGVNRMLDQRLDAIQNQENIGPANGIGTIAPQVSSIKQSNFMRYYEHPMYAELGFSPYANNEEYYNTNSNAWDDLARTSGSFVSLMGTGFKSVYRNLSDPFGPDLKSAREFEEAMAIGSSTRDGAAGFTNNLFLNAGYTFGIIGSIAAEEIVLAGATALSGGTLALPAAAKTGLNAVKLGKTIANSFGVTRIAAATKKMLTAARNVDGARDVYNGFTTAGKFVGKVFAPETVAAIRSLKTAQNGAQNLSNMAKASKTFGGFYKDLRSLNLALAESSLEAGMVYNQRINENLAIQSSKNLGDPVTSLQLESIQNNASKAGFDTLLANAPLIFLSNQIVLGNAFGGFSKSFARLANEKVTGIGRRIIQKSKGVGKDGKKVLDVFEDAGTGFKGLVNRFTTAGIKGNTRKLAGASLRFFSANFAEGLQEIGQEAISGATNDYYKNIFTTPGSGGYDLYKQSVHSAVSDQFSAQGFETFMSGFLMGGIVQGPQKLFFQGIPATYRAAKGKYGSAEAKAAYAQQNEAQENWVKNVVKSYNEAWNQQAEDPSQLWDPAKLNFLIQKQVAGELTQSNYMDDRFGFIDAKDFAKFQQIYTVLSTGGAQIFQNQLEDYAKLSDQELIDAGFASKKEVESGKARERFQSMINQIEKTDNDYNNRKDDFPNPYDRQQFKKGTKEYQQEAIKEAAWAHANYLYMFTKDGFDRALERSNSIYQTLASDPLFENMAASDITVLLDKDSIDQELSNLEQELSVLTGDTAENKKLIKDKTDKRERLSALEVILSDPKNLNKDGSFNKSKVSNKLLPEFEKYVKYLAGSNGTFANKQAIQEALKDIVDYKALKGRAKTYDKTIEYLNNPERFNEIFERQNQVFTNAFETMSDDFKAVIEEYAEVNKKNELVNQIAGLDNGNVIIPPEKAKAFLATGLTIFLNEFYNKNGQITKTVNPLLYAEIQGLLEVYTATSKKEAQETEAAEVSKAEAEIQAANREEVNASLEELGIEEEIAPSNSDVYKALLLTQYKNYQNTQLNKKTLPYAEWINTEPAKNFRNAFAALKNIWIANDKLINPNNPLTKEQKLDDTLFINWLLSDNGLQNNLVSDVLQKLDLSLSDVTGQTVSMEAEGENFQGNPNRQVYGQPGVNFSIITETTYDADGGAIQTYTIVDSKTKEEVSPEVLEEYGESLGLFTDLDNAEKLRARLEEDYGNVGEFVYDGEILNTGGLVYKKDKEGNLIEYKILSKPNKILEGKNLTLIPNDKSNLSFDAKKEFLVFVKPGAFKGFYDLQKIDMDILADDVSRLDVSEPVTPYGYRNKNDKGQFTETYQEGVNRYNAIISALTQDEIKNLELVITLDPEAGKQKGLYVYPGNQPNKYIQKIQSKYIIGIKTSDPSILGKINKALSVAGIDPSTDAQGIFGFINTENFYFEANGVELKPNNFTIDQANNLIRLPEYLQKELTAQQALELIKKNFATSQVLTNTLNGLFYDEISGETITLKVSDLPNDISFNLQLGKTDYDNSSTRTLNQLDYNRVDEAGNYLIYKLEKGSVGQPRTVTGVTNLEGTARRELLNKVQASLGYRYEEMLNGTDGYMAVVLMPNGTYSLVNLAAEPLNFDELMLETIAQAQKVIGQLPKGTGTQLKKGSKELKALRVWNKALNEKLFITNNPGVNISLQVSPWGKIELQVSVNENRLETVRLSKDTIMDEGILNPKKINDFIQEFNNNKTISDEKISLSPKNFTASFPRNASIGQLLELTTTNVMKSVTSPAKLQLFADPGAEQAAYNTAQGTSAEDRAAEVVPTTEDPIEEGVVEPVDKAMEVVASPLVNIKAEIKALKTKLQEGKSRKEQSKALRESEEYQKLLAKKVAIMSSANKILNAMSITDVEDINTFMLWAEENLPDFISIEDIALLGDNLKAGGERVGAFVLNLNHIAGGKTINGTIYTGANSPFRYHEAFHGVFRMLLSDAEITKYLGIARKEVRAKLRLEGKNLKKELEMFRRSANTYTNMSDARLEQEYYEEYLADQFELFKTGPKNTKTSSEVKSLFTRILEWIESVFKSYSKNDLNTLFENIDAGKYYSSTPVVNQFTSQTGITLEANALLPYDEREETTEVLQPDGSTKQITREGFLYVDNDVADPLIRSIAAMYLSRMSKNTDPLLKKSDILNGVMDDFYELYNSADERYANKSEREIELLDQVSIALDESPAIIKDQVYSLLNIIDGQAAEEEYNQETMEESIGLRGIDEWGKDASMVGGIQSTPKDIRAFIATTTKEATDYFGNTELVSGEALIIPVDFVDVYNGLLKSVKNIENPKAMLQNMYFFGQDNLETGAVVNKLLASIGVSVETLLSDSPLSLEIKKPQLFQAFTKAFENFRVDYLFTQRDNAGNVLMYSAAQRDDVNSQLVRWAQAWTQKDKIIKSDSAVKTRTENTLDDLQSLLFSNKKITNKSLTEESKKYQEALSELLGIKLGRQFIAFSIVSAKPLNVLTVKQKALINANSNESPLLSEEIVEMLKLIQTGVDLYSEEGMNSRLRNIAIRNAPFDETIGLSVFKNAEGNLVYAHQKPTYHLKAIQKLNDLDQLEGLKAQFPYLENNYLLNSDAFVQLSADQRQKILRFAGSAVGKINKTEEEINANISGVSSRSTYGNFTPQEFALTLINSYTALVNTKSGRVDFVEYFNNAENLEVKTALAPILLRVLESSNTGDMAYMPVLRAVETSNGVTTITDETLNIYVDSIETEFNRIKRERTPETKTERSIVGYNQDNNGRAFKLHNSELLLSPQIKTQLEEIANRGGDVTLNQALDEINMTRDEFKSELNNILEDQFTEFKSELVALNLNQEISNSIKNGLDVSANFEESAEMLNLINDADHNLKQIFFNDWVNTKALNEILLGDQAVTLKNGVDAIKRAKAQNAATVSAYSAITAPELGINHTVDKVSGFVLEEPIGKSSLGTNKNIEEADAQLYYTTKGLRYTEFGFGKLTPMQASLLDRIENDGQLFVDPLKYQDPKEFKSRKKITSEEIFGKNGYVQNGAMLNSRKLVYADGRTFIKMSAFPLIPQLTSNNIETNPLKPPIWEAKPNMVQLHNLRMKLEAEELKSGSIAIAAPLSAYKMLKQDVTSLSELNNTSEFTNKPSELSAKNLGLQVEMPSNKLEIVDPTQIKNIITSEQKDNVYVEALGLTVGQIRKEYNKATGKRVELKFKNKRNLVYTFKKKDGSIGLMDELKVSVKQNKITPNLTAFLRYAQAGLKASESSSNLLEFFSTINGEQQYDLNNPITVNKFEGLFLTYLSKGSLSEKLPGHSLALVSDFGVGVYRKVYSFDSNGIPERSEIIREGVWNKMKNKPALVESTNGLDTETEPNWSGVKIPKGGFVVIQDRLRAGVKAYDSKGKETGERYTEMMMPAHFKSVMDLVENGNRTMPDVVSKMFAIRIPSQDNHSTINTKYVDFLPAVYGSVAMFARELVEISGADFDIDKVYSQIKEWYVKDGVFIEYGKATTEQGQYNDYIEYVKNQVAKKGSIYNEALSLYKQDDQAIKVSNSSALVVSDALGKGYEDVIISLEMLGLPISKQQYLTYKKKNGEPYVAALNNNILDYKYALMGNRGVTESTTEETPISYTAAALDILEDEWKVLQEITKLEDGISPLTERSREDNIDIDNILGKIKAFKANKGAAIGAIVLPNQYLSLLTEYKIKLKSNAPSIVINGVTYNDFGVLREKLSKTEKGLRKQDIISSLITMATDNAKERLVAKLGLNRSALGLVGNLTALGVPINTSLLLINNPLIQDIYNQALNKKEKMDPGVDSLVDAMLEALNPKGKKFKALSVTNELLINSIKLPNEVSDQVKFSILKLFKSGNVVVKFTGNMAAVSNLTQGLGKDMAAINKKANQIETLLDPKAIMDLSSIYLKDTWQAKYLEIFNSIRTDLLPVTFLSASPQFIEIMDSVLINVDTESTGFDEEVEAKISRDLLSYITIKAYQTKGQNIATLSNEFIYPSDLQSIDKLVEDMRATDIGKDNFFLQTFATVNAYTNKDNNTGLNIVEANTYRSINKLQKIDLQTSFAQLYGSATMRDSALAIVNYMMVKDGLQLTYGTLMDAVSPFIMNSYLSHIQTANLALRDGSNVKMKEVFGLTKSELSKEFVNGYLESNTSNSLLNTFTKYSEDTNLSDGVLTVGLNNNPQSTDLEYARYKSIDPMGNERYTTYKLDAEKSNESNKVFNTIETYGSNQQNGIGFMFGERPTYQKVRESVKEKNYGSDTNLDGVYNQDEQINYASMEAEQNAALEDALKNGSVDVVAGIASDIKVNGEDISKIEPKIAAPTRSLEIPEYKINRQLQNQDESIRYASTNGTTITLNPVEGKDGRAKFFDYFTGQEGGVTSKQKAKVLEAVAAQGWSMDRITNLLSSNKLINTFLVLHEQDHINNNDKSVYWKNGRDLLTQDKIDIEARATIVALLQIDAIEGGTIPTQQTSDTINIYAGTNENAELSNFANRPFSYKGREYKNVEQAFQYQKLMGFAPNSGGSNFLNDEVGSKILQAKTGAEAKKLGRQIKQLNTVAWDRSSSSIMKDLITESFKQNPQALAKLLATGNATLTHTQDKTKYRELFPKILMEVRQELSGSQQTQQTSDVESLEMEGAAQLQLDLQFELEADLTDVNVALEVYWEEQIEPFPEKKAKLREQKLYPFSKMIKAFNEGTYIPTDEMTSEEVFMDEINNCIL